MARESHMCRIVCSLVGKSGKMQATCAKNVVERSRSVGKSGKRKVRGTNNREEGGCKVKLHMWNVMENDTSRKEQQDKAT